VAVTRWFFQAKIVYTIQGGQKSKPLPNDHKMVIHFKSLSISLDFFAQLKYKSSTIILFAGIKYSVRDLFSDLNNYA